MPTVLVSSLPILPFYLLFIMDFLSQSSSKVVMLPLIVSVVMHFAGDSAGLSVLLPQLTRRLLHVWQLGPNDRFLVMRKDSVAGSRCMGWQPMSGQNHPGRLLNDHIAFTRLHCLSLGVRGKRFQRKEGGRTLPKVLWNKFSGISFFTICL